MAPTKPMLDGVELPQAQRIASEDEEVLAQHGVPALEGDFLQDLGRRAVRVTLTGVLTGPEAGEDLKGLREKFQAAAPVPFVSDIATATRVDKVLIEEMGVRELAGKTERFEYALSLREYTPPPAVTEEIPPAIPVPPVPETATLVVEVIVEGDPAFDFSRVRVTATSGTAAASRTLTNRVENVWTEADVPPGQYTVEAVVDDPADPMTGSAPAEVREGETTQVTITLRRGSRIAKAFVIHFWFDKAFVEPCLREVLARVAAHSDAHPDEKVLIVGHTDLTGSDAYNQSLSERRARSVHAFLTFGRDRATAVAEWNELRRTRPAGQITTVQDTWSTREYQYMLQDLGFYLGNIDEDHGTATAAAVRAFQGDSGLTPSGAMDDGTWEKLVEAYLEQDSFALPRERFFRNTRGACDGGLLQWLGCGEQDPVLNTEKAWRPNRRTEILFIRAAVLPPDEIPEPDTFNLPTAGANGTSWCLGPRNRTAPRCTFTTRTAPPPAGKLLILPAEPGKVQVTGTITFEDGTPVANARYSLTAPDGEYLNTAADRTPPPQREELPDLEEKQADPAPNLPPRLKQKGRPIPNRADAQGRFRCQRETPEGVYILELQGLTAPQVARSTEEAVGSGRGNVVCFRVDAADAGSTKQSLTEAPVTAPATGEGGVVQSAPAPAAPVNPEITPADPVVVVRRSYTSPGRVPITLRTSARFRRDGILTRSGNTGAIRLYRAATGGSEIFASTPQVSFDGALLSQTRGVQLFAESDTPSASVGDYELTLTLAPGSTPVGPPAVVRFTAVRVTLDIFTAREPSGAEPAALPQPPAAVPAAGTATDKWFGGGLVNAQDAAGTQERVKLRVRAVEPNDFAGTLELRQVAVAGNNVGAPASRARGFDNAAPTPGEAAAADPLAIPVGGLGFGGRDVFLEGRTVSAARRDTGFQLGVQGSSADGDRVALTVGVGVSVTLPTAVRAVVVKKPHTSPARRAITLRTTAPLPAARRGTLTVAAASGAVRIFDAAVAGNEITNTAANVFAGDRLTAGVQVFAEGVSACANLDDVRLVLTLDPGAPPAGIPGSLRLTCVEVTLDVGLPRTAPAVDPAPMPAADKAGTGRFIQVALPDDTHERPTLFVRAPVPASFVCRLVLRPLAPPAVTGTPVQIFDTEIPAPGQVPLTTPLEIASFLTLPGAVAGGVRFFAQAGAVSAAARDTGVQLGIVGLEDDGDRVPMTALILALTDNTAPFGTVVPRVQIEGILNSDRTSYDLGDLFLTQAASLFRARVDVPGVAAGAQVQARLVSRRTDGTLLENHDLNLSRTVGDRFASLPILAIPEAFPRAEITFRAPQDIEVVRCEAGGTLRLELLGPRASGGVRAGVRGRVLELCTLTIVGASPNIAANLRTANRVMAQAGIEFRASNLPPVNNAALLDIQQTDCPLTIGGDASRGAEEIALFALGRGACASNFIAYFVRSNSLGLFGCSAFPAGRPGVTVADTASQYTFVHEIGHVLHLPHDDSVANNLMTGGGTNSLPANPANVRLLAAQCQLMYNSGFLVLRG